MPIPFQQMKWMGYLCVHKRDKGKKKSLKAEEGSTYMLDPNVGGEYLILQILGNKMEKKRL